jgi:hypothetical protein
MEPLIDIEKSNMIYHKLSFSNQPTSANHEYLQFVQNQFPGGTCTQLAPRKRNIINIIRPLK